MKILFLTIFIVSTAIHLYASAKSNKKLRNVTKPFILPSLLGYYCVATSIPMTSVIFALIFSFLGDVLLIPKGVKWFTAGGISFMVSHAFFIVSYAHNLDLSKIGTVVAVSAVFVIAVIAIFSKLKEHLPKPLFYPMFFYLLLNGAMNCFAFFRLISNPCQGNLITFIGAVLFFISDSCLFFVRFNKNGKQKTHFWVMLTYSIGEFLIVLGLI